MTGSKVGGRLGEAPAPELVELLYRPWIAEGVAHDFDHMLLVNRAHVVMLARRGVIAREAACSLLEALAEIAESGRAAIGVDPEREDFYFNFEHAVVERTGPLVGGQMHTGRSRNDLGATLSRLHARNVLVSVIEAALALRGALLAQAERYRDTLLPGYTHLQPAQPITLGHYLTGIEAALARDTDRLLHALDQTNRSPLGAAALAGTGFPIDREMTARFLGFDALVLNTLDAVASRDYLLEALAAGTIIGVTLSRFAQDLFIWYTREFGLIDFRDRVSGTSSIMPQKKNPVVLETIKGRTAHALGAFTAATGATRNTNFSNVIDANREASTLAWPALDALRESLALTRLAVENLIVDAELMRARCQENFSTVTQLADTLVTEWRISFRQAHEIVGSVVKQAIDADLLATDIDPGMVQAAARELLSEHRTIDSESLRDALDPAGNVRVRDHEGGPAPQAVASMIHVASRRLEQHQGQVATFRGRVQDGQRSLASAIREVCEADTAAQRPVAGDNELSLRTQ